MIVYSKISVRQYIDEYRDHERFLGYCKECNGYGKTWACPPFDKDMLPILEQYEYGYILATKMEIDPQDRVRPRSAEQSGKLYRKIMDQAREGIDDRLLELERSLPSARIFYPGSCKRCRLGSCTRLKGEPCIKPDEMRPSLEAVGFDIGKTTSQLLGIDLKWGNGYELPEYITLVYGIFSKEEIALDLVETL